MKTPKTPLQTNLEGKLSEADISVHALEKQAGLKRSAVQNILHGRSKKPSAEILAAISRVLGCSIQELLEPTSNNSSITNTTQINIQNQNEEINLSLYIKALQEAERLLSLPTNNIKIKKAELFKYADDVYAYTLETGHSNIDPHFAKWLFDKMFANKS